jgi:tetratricopeptide (TPR) repeat protein
LLFALAGATSRRVEAAGQTTTSAYDRAYQLLAGGNAAEALTEIDAALKAAPSNVGLYNLRGLAAAQLGRVKEAETSFRKVIELAPQSAMGYVNLATFLSERGKSAEAAGLFRAALEREPNNFTALSGLGVTLTELREYGQATPFLDKARRLRPKDFQVNFEYARALRELKRPLVAEEVLAAIKPPSESALAAKYFALSAVVAVDRGKRKRATELYSRAYQLASDSFDIYLGLARAFLNAAPPEERNGARSKAGATEPNLAALPAPPQHLSAEQNFALGLLFASRGAFAQAIPFFEETLRMEPASYAATFNLALAYKGAGKIESAISLIEQGLEEKPTAELYDLLASLDETAGKYIDALRHYQEAVKLEPGNEQYYFNLGSEYLAHFTFGPAVEAFDAGAKKFPNAARQFLGLGLAHYALRQYRQASEALLKALEIDPTSPSAYSAWNSVGPSLAPADWKDFLPRLERLAAEHPANAQTACLAGALLFRYGVAVAEPADFAPAQLLLERALRLKPQFSDAHIELGNLFMERKDFEMAAAQYREAVREDPQSQMAHYRLGQAYRDLNKLELAERELARYANLARNRREEMARSRSAIRQFVLTQSSATGAVGSPPSPPADQK